MYIYIKYIYGNLHINTLEWGYAGEGMGVMHGCTWINNCGVGTI